MVSPGSRLIVARRAATGTGAVAATLATVLVVCALVAGVVGVLDPLQQQALGTSMRQVPADQTVVEVSTAYEPRDAREHDRAVREVLQPLVAGGGQVLRRTSTVEFREPGSRRTWTFTSVTPRAGAVRVVRGRMPQGGGRLEAAVPQAQADLVGRTLTLRNPLDRLRTRVAVVGAWAPRPGGSRALGETGARALLVPEEAFGRVASRAASVRWRAVPPSGLEPDQLDPLAAAATRVDADVAALGERAGTSLRVDNPLPETLRARAGELSAQRTLLLVPALILLLLGAASTVLVASAVSQSRRDEEALLRSRGAGRFQLVGPTMLEAVLVCAAAGLAGPPLAAAVVRVEGVSPQLDATTWGAGAVAAGVCAVALVLPTLARALSGDRGEQLSVTRQRRRTLTLLIATGLLVLALGAVGVAGIRGFADSVAGGTRAVDPLDVAGPALLLLSTVGLLVATLLPVLLQLLARTLRSRSLGLALGTRFAARAPSRTIPLALVVALVAGATVFAVVESTSHREIRAARAGYEVGADVRVTTPPQSFRAAPRTERRRLEEIDGVREVAAVDRELDFVEEVPVEVVTLELTGDVGQGALAAAEDPASVQARLEQPADGAAPAVVTDDLTERASLDTGDRLELPVGSRTATLEIVGTLPHLPTVSSGHAGLLVARSATHPGPPDEWWLGVADGRVGEVAASLRKQPGLASTVQTRTTVLRRLADDPGTGGAGLTGTLTVTAAGALVLGGVLLVSLVLLRRRERVEQARVLRVVGAADRDVTATLVTEYAVTTGAGALAGACAGVVVAAVAVPAMTLGAAGEPVVPRPEVALPWTWLVATPLALVVPPLLALLLLARPKASSEGDLR